MSNDQSDLLNSPELLKLILDVLPVGVWVIDRQGNILHGNREGQKIWEGVRYVGIAQYGEYKAWWRDSGKRVEPDEWAAARVVKHGETCLNDEVEIECFDGTRKIILNSGVPIRDEAGEVIGGVIVNVDITSRVRLEDKLRNAVDIDTLTQAYSRRRFYELLNEEIARANRYRRPLSLVMLDVDRFKAINDEHGHLVGDQVLAAISRLVRGQIRESEHLARYGGDEFMLLLPEVELDDAVSVVERLRTSLSTHLLDPVGAVACSFGVCECRPDDTADNLIRRADGALYKAKASGRNRVSVCAQSGD